MRKSKFVCGISQTDATIRKEEGEALGFLLFFAFHIVDVNKFINEGRKTMRLTMEQKFWNFEKLITMLYGQRGEGLKEHNTDLAGMVRLCNGNHIQASPFFMATIQGKEVYRNRTLFGSIRELFSTVTTCDEARIGTYLCDAAYGNGTWGRRDASCYSMCISVSSVPEIDEMDMEEAGGYILGKYPALKKAKPNYVIRNGNGGLQILYIFAQNIAGRGKEIADLQKAFMRMFLGLPEGNAQFCTEVCLPYSKGRIGREADIVFCNGRVYDFDIFWKELLSLQRRAEKAC